MSLKNRILFFLSILIIEACTSTKSTTFYQLKTLPPSQEEKKEPGHKAVNIFIKPVIFPEYLDRPQMVYRESGYKLLLSEYNRWAAPLKENFTQVFIENLNARITPGHAMVYSDLGKIKPNYQLSIEVLQMDVDLKNQAVLKVKWTLIEENNTQRIQRLHNEYSIPVVSDKFYESGVEAQSEAIALFADEVADILWSIQIKKLKGSEYE
jgi:uncharacterized lipoprotein YmbA